MHAAWKRLRYDFVSKNLDGLALRFLGNTKTFWAWRISKSPIPPLLLKKAAKGLTHLQTQQGWLIPCLGKLRLLAPPQTLLGMFESNVRTETPAPHMRTGASGLHFFVFQSKRLSNFLKPGPTVRSAFHIPTCYSDEPLHTLKQKFYHL